MPTIIADENIPFAKEAFCNFGEVHTMPGRAINTGDLRDADVLLVRSVTRVDASLLSESKRLRFVGTATIGTDHIDTEYLAQRGIAFSSAPGCNANSVAEYIVAALLEIERQGGATLAGASLGIIGVGNIGSIVMRYAQALGMKTVAHDPPRAAMDVAYPYQPREAIYECDYVTLHVPYSKVGAYPTWHLADKNFLDKMKHGGVLLNTSRGAVADNQALKTAIQGDKIAAALDVWEGEPCPDWELLSLCAIATPHIAGYSYDGKVNATLQLYEAYCRLSGEASVWNPAELMPPPEHPEINLIGGGNGGLRGAMRQVYDIMSDDADLRKALDMPAAMRGAYFDQLRKRYRVRRESPAYCALVDRGQSALESQLISLGFQTKVAES